MDQDATRYGGRPSAEVTLFYMGTQLTLHGKGHTPLFAHVYCGQTAGWIKIPLATEVGHGPGDIVLDGDRRKGAQFAYAVSAIFLLPV